MLSNLRFYDIITSEGCIMKNIFRGRIFKTIVAAAIIAIAVFAFVACAEDETVEKTFEEQWMSYISDEALVSEVVMPGAHDAGTMGADKMWETQHSKIEDQLKAGARYFDFRASKPVSGNTDTYYFVHADSNMPVLENACGQLVEESMEAIKTFVESNPEEVLILDFQHSWTATEEGLVEFVESLLPMDKVLRKTDVADPTTVSFGKMRELGKNIIVIYKDTSSDICEKHDWLFERSVYLQSDYQGSEHKGDTDKLKAQWEKYFAVKKDGVFFVLQSQLTGSPLEGREALIRPVLDDYLKNVVAKDADKLAGVNVVMKDFIADDVTDCSVSSKAAIHTILSLNVDKGTVKADKLEDFKAACGIV